MAEEIQKKKISALPSATSLSDTDVFPVVQGTGISEDTKKADIGLVGTTIAESEQFSNLNTESKTLVGAINELEASGGGATAEDTSYDNSTSGLLADNVQEAIDEIVQGGGGAPTAEHVSYDNTTSGLTATDVQEAIDELAQGSGGSTVTVTQIQSTGTKIATITVDSYDTDLYAPSGGGASAFEDLTDVDIDSTTLATGQIPVYNATTEKWENGSLRSSIYTDLTDTLEAGETSLTISDAIITTSSVIDIYTDSDVPYNSLTVSNGSITIAFESQASDMGVRVRVWVTPPEAEGSSF